MNMNRFIFLLFSFISVSASFAQLNGDGYYRVQNQYTSRYVVVLSNKADINYATNEVDLGSIETLKPFNKIVSNPASVIYIEKKPEGGIGHIYMVHAEEKNVSHYANNVIQHSSNVQNDINF